MNTSVAGKPIVAADTAVWIRVVGVFGFAIATAVSAQIAIPLPHTPVPITLQTAVVLLAGATLGARLGVASMLLYLLLGAAGFHFFALGNWGFATVLGASGGYLCGFVLAQPIVGGLTRLHHERMRGHRFTSHLVVALLLGNAVIFAVGLPWLAIAMQVSTIEQTLQLGLYPFLPGLVVKTALAALAARWIVPRYRRLFEPTAR